MAASCGPREDSEHVRAADVCHVDGVTRRPREAVAGACCMQAGWRPITFLVKLPCPVPVFLPICPLSTSCPATQLNIFIKGKKVFYQKQRNISDCLVFTPTKSLCAAEIISQTLCYVNAKQQPSWTPSPWRGRLGNRTQQPVLGSAPRSCFPACTCVLFSAVRGDDGGI